MALGTATAIGLGRFAYGLLLPAMSDDLRWTYAAAGTITTANGLGYLVGAMSTAPLARRFGTAFTFRAGMVVCAVSLAATAVGDAYEGLLLARVVAGIGGALVFITGAVIAPGAVYFAGTGLGILLCGATLPFLLDLHPDRWPVAWIGMALVAGAAVALSWTAAGPDQRVRVAGSTGSLRPLVWLAVTYLLFAIGYIAYITFLSAYLVDRGATPLQTAVTWSLLGAAVMAAPGLWSRPIRRWPGRRVLATLLAGVGGSSALALLSSSPAVVLVSALAYGATFMAVPAAVTSLVRSVTSPEALTGALAALTVVFAAGQTVGPWLSGVMADLVGPAGALAWTAVLCGAASLLAGTAVGAGTPSRPALGRVD